MSHLTPDSVMSVTAERQLAWTQHSSTYANLVQDTARDSRYLREHGLKPTLLRMAGNCQQKRVLDAGCGDGWLLRALAPRDGHGCDVSRFKEFPDEYHFSVNDVRDLSHPDDYFDLVVNSLVLMWIPELDAALSQLRRVTKPGGQVITAIMQPYFYRTGEVDAAGNFVVGADLSKPFVLEKYKIADSVGPFAYHYRPLPDYLNACIRAGLRIEQVADWFIDLDDFIARFGTDQPTKRRRTGKVPMYSFIKCTRIS